MELNLLASKIDQIVERLGTASIFLEYAYIDFRNLDGRELWQQYKLAHKFQELLVQRAPKAVIRPVVLVNNLSVSGTLDVSQTCHQIAESLSLGFGNEAEHSFAYCYVREIRNRLSRRIRSSLKQVPVDGRLCRANSQVLAKLDDEKTIVLATIPRSGGTVVSCPGIIAEHYYELISSVPDQFAILIVDFSRQVDFGNVLLGAKALQSLVDVHKTPICILNCCISPSLDSGLDLTTTWINVGQERTLD